MTKTINIFAAEKPAGRLDVGAAAGSSETAMYIYDIAPGGSSSPYHLGPSYEVICRTPATYLA